MTDEDRRSEEDAEMDDAVVTLIRLAGPRAMPPAERAARVRAGVHAAWRQGVRRRRTRNTLLAAAAVLAGIALGLTATRAWRDQRGPAPVVARLDTAAGRVETLSGDAWLPLAAGETVTAGALVRTAAAARAGFRLDDGHSVRLDAGSRLRWHGQYRLALEAGAVYVDSGPGQVRRSSLEVATPRGSVREVGTQFEARLERDALVVRVREGRVVVRAGDGTHDAQAGVELRLDDAGVTHRDVAPHDAAWSWVLELAPRFEIEGRQLVEFLAWSARENGWSVRYADDGSRRAAHHARLHGSIDGLRPDEAVAVVLPATGLAYRLRHGVIEVGPARPVTPP